MKWQLLHGVIYVSVFVVISFCFTYIISVLFLFLSGSSSHFILGFILHDFNPAVVVKPNM